MALRDSDSVRGNGQLTLLGDDDMTFLRSRKSDTETRGSEFKSNAFFGSLTRTRPGPVPAFPSASAIENLDQNSPNHTPTGPSTIASSSYFPMVSAPETPRYSTHSPAPGDQVASQRQESSHGSPSPNAFILDEHRGGSSSISSRGHSSFVSSRGGLPSGRKNKDRLFHEALTWPELYDQLQADKDRLKQRIKHFDQDDRPVVHEGDVFQEWRSYEQLAKGGVLLDTDAFYVYAGSKFYQLSRLKMWLNWNLHINPKHTWPPRYESPFSDNQSVVSSVYSQASTPEPGPSSLSKLVGRFRGALARP
ncbi:MAG: hypothetical protein Q9184_000734 [Pyrenodesmia sp. 2 TL-2023]